MLMLLQITIHVLYTSVISGATGMAGGVVLMIIFASIMPFPEALILHAITQASSNGFRALINKEHIKKDIVVKYLAGAAISYAIFSFINFQPSKKIIFITLGFMPFIVLFKKLSLRFDIEKKGRPFICGVLVSATQVMAGVSGAVLDLFYISSKLDRFNIVATKATTQAIGHGIKIALYFHLMNISPSSIDHRLYLACIITPIFGALIGKEILKKFSNDSFSKIVRVTMIVLSGSMLYKGFSL